MTLNQVTAEDNAIGLQSHLSPFVERDRRIVQWKHRRRGGGPGRNADTSRRPVSLNNVTADNNRGDGLQGDAGSLVITGGSFSTNGENGTYVFYTDSIAVNGSTFNANAEHGIKATTIADSVILQRDRRRKRNRRLRRSATSFSDTDGSYIDNDDHGIHLLDIAGNVTLVRTTLDDNDADDDGTGDGLNATAITNPEAIGGNLLVQGATICDTDGSGATKHQDQGVYVESIARSVTFEDAAGPAQWMSFPDMTKVAWSCWAART